MLFQTQNSAHQKRIEIQEQEKEIIYCADFLLCIQISLLITQITAMVACV